MNRRNQAQGRLWIRDRDSVGNTIDHRLVEAAHRVWERARLVVIRYLAEDTDAAEILESAVDSASRLLGNDQAIESVEAYLLKSVARESVRRRRRNRRIAYVDGADLERLAGPASTNLERELDETKRIEAFVACMDEPGRTLYALRVLGFNWRKIASLTGYSDAHSALVQFRRKMDRALERFRANHDSSWKPQSSV
jgi:DNA-directed RNA polymerase specialized sigma24 family protein